MYKENKKIKNEYRKVTTKAKYFVVISLFLLLLLVIVGSSSWNLHMKVFGFTKNATIVSGEKASSLLRGYVDYGTTNTITYSDQEYYAYTYDGNTHSPTIINRDDDARDFDLTKFKYTYTCLFVPKNATSGEWEAVNPQTTVLDEPKDSGLYKVDINYNDSTYSDYVGSATIYFAIQPKAIDVSVSPNESVYGAPINPIEQTVAEGVLCGTDSVDSLDSEFSLASKKRTLSAAGEDQRLAAGEYDIIGTDNSRNYAITFKPKVSENGTHALYTVTKRPITVKILDQTSVYGDLPFDFTNLNEAAQLTANTLSEPDTLIDVISVSSGLTLLESVGTISSNAGTYAIVGSNENPNYEVTFVGSFEGDKGTYTITKAPLNMTATSFKLIYGDQIPAYSVTYEGFKNGETKDVIEGNPTFTCSYAQNKQNGSVGSYTITPSLGEQTNYEINPIDGTLEVSKKALTLTLDAKLIYYGEDVPSYTCTAEGFVYSENFTTYKSDFSLTNYVTDNYKVGDSIGEYNITWSKAESELENILTNYDCTLSTNKLTVNARPITVTITDKSSAYGTNQVELTSTVAVTQGYTLTGNPIYGTEKPYTLSTSVTNTSNVGTYPIVGAKTNNNYDITFVGTFESTKGTYTVTKKAITLTWNASNAVLEDGVYSFTYNGENQAPTATTEGFVLEDIDKLTISVPCDNKNVSNYTATASVTAKNDQGNNLISNYAITNPTQAYKIKPKPVDIAWNDNGAILNNNIYEFIYNASNQTITAEVVANSLCGSDTCTLVYEIVLESTVVTETKNAGEYTITATDVSNPNYILQGSNLSQAFKINPKTVTINDWVNTELTYNGAAQAPTSTTVGVISGDDCTITVLGAETNVGEGYTATATLSGTKCNNYTLASENATVTFTIKPKEITITWTNTAFTYSGTNQIPTAVANGLVANDGSAVNVTGAEKDANTSSNPTYTATASIVKDGATDTNYTITSGTTQNFTIEKAPLKITADSYTISFGGELPTYTATYDGLVNNEPASVLVGTLSFDAPTSSNEYGTFDIVPSGLTSNNYAITYVNGVLRIVDGTMKPEVVKDSFVYDGTEKTIEFTNFVDAKMSFSEDSIISATNAGTYTATVTLADDAVWVDGSNNPLTFTWTITQATTEITGTLTIGGWIYGGMASTPSGLSTNFGTIQYQYSSEQNGTYSATQPTNAGSYFVKGVIVGNDNYSSAETTPVAFTISQKSITITWSADSFPFENGVYKFTYNGTSQVPTATPSGLITGDGSSVKVAGAGTNVGTYTATASIVNGDVPDTNYIITSGATQAFTIEKLSIYLSSGVIEKSYSDSNKALSTADICGYFRATGDIVDATKVAELVNTNFTIKATLKNYTTNVAASDVQGLFSYTINNDSSVEITKGSTYLITLTVGNQNSNIAYSASTSGKLYYKYKTAMVGSEYFTIEDALAQNGDITLAGGASYVITAFSKLELSSTNGDNFAKYKSNYEYTLSHTLLVPCDDSTTGYTIDKNSAKGVYSVLCIPESISMTLGSGSKLTAASTISYSQPNTTISNTRGVVMNSGNIIAESGSNIYSYGYIKGNGLIDLREGATATDCLSTYDWPGGNTSTKICDRVLPMNAWSLHNISCDMKIAYNANLKAFFYTNASMDVAATVDLISNSSTNGLFIGISGYIKKSSANKGSTKDLDTIAGSNQIFGQRDLLEIYGEYKDAVLKVAVSGFSMTTSTAISCPFGYMDIILRDSTNLTLAKSDYLFLPGTSLTIDSGATLTTEADVDLSFETVAHIESVKSGGYDFSDKCVKREDAKLIVNGTFICKGNLGGKIITTGTTGILNLTNATLTSSFYSLYHGVGASASKDAGVAYQVTSFYARGNINESVLRAFNKITYNANQNGSNYVWVGNSYNSAITDFNGTIDPNAIMVGGCLVEGTLITLADGTKKKVEDITENDVLLVFNHYTGRYEYAKVLFNDYEPLSLCNVINLHFSNGIVVKVVTEHGFFDLDLNKYVYIDEYNYAEYIGHHFYSATWNGNQYKDCIVTLNQAYLTQEEVRIYSPVTKYHMNYFTEDLLSMPGGIQGIFNIFEYGEGLKFDEELMQHDIELYGEFTYEDFKDLVTEDIYNSFQARYFTVAMGKGNLTMEMLQYYINRYGPLMMANSDNSTNTGQSTDKDIGNGDNLMLAAVPIEDMATEKAGKESALPFETDALPPPTSSTSSGGGGDNDNSNDDDSSE